MTNLEYLHDTLIDCWELCSEQNTSLANRLQKCKNILTACATGEKDLNNETNAPKSKPGEVVTKKAVKVETGQANQLNLF